MKMKKKLVSLSVAFVVLLNIVISVPFLSLMAAEPVLELGSSVSPEAAKPGQIVDITVDLGNYSQENVPEIVGLQLNIPMAEDAREGPRYVDGSAQVLLEADGMKSVGYNQQLQSLVMVYVYNGQPLPKEEEAVLTFQVEVTGQYGEDTVLELPVQSIAQKKGNETIQSSVDTIQVPVLVEDPVIQLNGGQNTGLAYDSAVTVTFDKGSATISKDGGEATPLENGAVVDQPGVYTVTVTDAAGNQARETFSLVAIHSISVTPPAKTQYIQGEDFDPTGGVVTTTYSDGATKETPLTTGMCQVDMDQVGTQEVTVSYNGKQASFEISIAQKEVTSLTIAQLPDKLTYVQNEPLDLTGGKLLIGYNNGKSEEIDLSSAQCDADTSVVSDACTVTVSYGGQTTSFSIVVERGDVTSIQMQQLPAKTQYYAGEALDVAGGKILVTYEGGSQEQLDLTEAMCQADLHAAGQQQVTVTYGGQTTSFAVEVLENAVTAIRMEKQPDKTTYKVGESFSAQGGMLQITRQNGMVSYVDLTDDMCTVPAMDTAGLKQVTVTYEGQTTSFAITVEEKNPERITMEKNPDKTIYVEGSQLDVAGGLLRVWYDDGTSQDVALTEAMCSGFDGSQLGTQTVTVTYEGLTTSFDVLVNAKTAVGLSLKETPERTHYLQQESLDVTGGLLVVHFDNGENQEIPLTVEMCSGYDMAKPGTQTVTIHYLGLTAQYDIVVREKSATGISFDQAPQKVEYLEGQDLDLTDVWVKVEYDNGQSETMAVDPSMVSGYDAGTVGTQTVTVWVQDQSVSFEVTVFSKAEVEELIAAIDKINLDDPASLDMEMLNQLKAQYDGLAPVQQEAVTNFDRLMAALDGSDGILPQQPYQESFLDGLVQIEGDAGSVPEGVGIQVEQKDLSTEQLGAVKAAYGIDSVVAASFGVTVDNPGGEILGTLKVSIKLDAQWGDGQKLAVALFDQDGTLRQMEATVIDGVLSFETDALGDFALVQEGDSVQPVEPPASSASTGEGSSESSSSNSASSNSGGVQSPHTGENTGLLYVWIGILVVSAAIIVVLLKKRRSM